VLYPDCFGVEAGEYEEPVPDWEHFGCDMADVYPWLDVMPLRGLQELEAHVGHARAGEAQRSMLTGTNTDGMIITP
jgi:hypothetical protein